MKKNGPLILSRTIPECQLAANESFKNEEVWC